MLRVKFIVSCELLSAPHAARVPASSEAFMHLKTCTGIALFFLIASLFAAPTLCAQTDLAISLYGAFSGATNGNGVQQSPSNSAGGILELRHISNPLVGYEATYSYNRATRSTPTQNTGVLRSASVPADRRRRLRSQPMPTKSPATGSFPSTAPISVLSRWLAPECCSMSRRAAKPAPLAPTKPSSSTARDSIGACSLTLAFASNTAATSTKLPTSLPPSARPMPSRTPPSP